MSDLSADRAAGGVREGGGDPWNGGPFPPVLLAALGAAAVIAIMLFALLGQFGGGEEAPAPASQAMPAAAGEPRQRVELMVTLQGSGEGEIRIRPGDVSCRRSCEHEFARGARVTVTADPASGSTFAGWGDSCDGTTRCSIVMDGERSLTARFDSEPDEAVCVEGDPGCPDADPGAGDDDLEAPDEDLDELDDAPVPAAVCADGRDNDRDGLTDSAQDPDCDAGSESGAGAAAGTPASPPPPPAAPVSDCADGRDNDRDGLTDRAQDPNCLDGKTEAG